MSEQQYKAVVAKLLDAWEREAKAYLFERSCNFDRDLAKLEEQKNQWKDLLELD